MKTTITVEITPEEKEQLFQILNGLNMTVDQVTEQFLKWCIEYPDKAVMWLRNSPEQNAPKKQHNKNPVS